MGSVFLVGCPWGGVCRSSFPDRKTPHMAAWSHIWSEQGWGEPYQGGRRGPRKQHNHLDSCSHSALAPTTSLALGSVMNTIEKGMWPWVTYGQNCGCLHSQCIGSLWPHKPRGFRVQLLGEWGHKRNGTLWNPTHRTSTPTTGERTLPPDKTVTTMEQTGGPAQHPVQALDTIPITPTIMDSKLRKQPLHQKYWTHTVYTRMLPHKKSPSRPQWIIFS